MKVNNTCKVPFGFIEIFENGDVYTCCKSLIKNGCIGNIFNQSFEEIFNSDKAKTIRRNCLNNDYSMCFNDLCSPNKDAFAFLLNSKYVGEIEYSEEIKYPKIIKFSYDLDCNVNCKSCREKIYRNSKEYIEELDEKARKYFLPILKYTDKVCLIGSGDPFASKHTRNFIKMIADEYPNMKFDLHTNGLLLNERMLTELNIIDKLSYIQISIHASTKETYDKIVLGGGWDNLMKNLEFVSNLKKQDKVENIFLFFVVSKINLGDAKEFVNLSKKYSAECFFWNLRDWGTQYTKNEIADEYEIYKAFKDDIFGDKIVHLNPYLYNIRNNENFLEDYFIKEINELKDKINCYDKRLDDLNCKIDKVVNSLAWWIPFRKWRDGFREKFKFIN